MSVLMASGSARPLPVAFILSAPMTIASVARSRDWASRIATSPATKGVDQPARHGPFSVTADK
jgi:hypothetical protein